MVWKLVGAYGVVCMAAASSDHAEYRVAVLGSLKVHHVECSL